MHLVYFSHSYRDPDAHLNEVFEELMISEGMVPSLDPPSDRLNSAKPERHLRSTDGMVAVLPFRDGGPSKYILYEIELCRRARKPVLVFVEDTLPSRILPPSVLGRRFCRRSLVRELRDHRHALRTLKAFIGEEPPPTYQPNSEQRYCVLAGANKFDEATQSRLQGRIAQAGYLSVLTEGGADCLIAQRNELMQAALTVAWVDALSAREAYALGNMQGGLVPAITFTANPNYGYDNRFPREYQPRLVSESDADLMCEALKTEIEIFEEDYLDLKDQEKAKRYRDAVIHVGGDGQYGAGTRMHVTNIVSGNAKVDMSNTEVKVTGNVGILAVNARLDRVTATINQTAGVPQAQREEFASLIEQLKNALKPIEASHADEAQRVVQITELAAAEVAKAKPDRKFLQITVAGLKSAAEAVREIAPAVLEVAGKIVSFFSGGI